MFKFLNEISFRLELTFNFKIYKTNYKKINYELYQLQFNAQHGI